MAITLEQANKFRADAGLPPLSQLGTPNQPTDNADSIIEARKKRLGELGLDAEITKPKTLGETIAPVTDIYKEGAQKITGHIKQAGERMAAEPSLIGKAAAIGKGAGDVATDVVDTAFEPIAKPLSWLIGKISDKISDIPAVQRLAATKAVGRILDTVSSGSQTLQEAQDKHPELADAFHTLVSIGGAAVGNKPVQEVASSIAKTTSKAAEAVGAKINEVGPKIGGAMDRLVEGSPEHRAYKSLNKTLDTIKATEDTMTKSERIDAINEGRQQPTKFGGKDFLPSETERRAAVLLDKKLTKNPVKNVPIIKREIAVRGAEAEKYLEKNAKPISNEEDFNMFQERRTAASKYMTDAEIEAYDQQVKLFQKQLPGRGKFDTNNYYKALKEYEDNIADKLPKGKAALIDPTGVASAKLRAAADVRKVVRDMIGSKNVEFKDKMFDLASLYDVKSTMVTKSDQLSGNKFTRILSHPAVKTGAMIGGGAALLGGGKNIVQAAVGN